MTKDTETKTNPPKKVPRKWIADAVGCGNSTVRQILNSGARSNETDLGQRIVIAEMLLADGIKDLLEEVKKVVA